ncbi:MAG TPA: DUF5916 domain-containing protein [Thermoanaerobaculia bacterium]|nr:DUF5916 domain-containing protein [Thermoanaerobaculia bacterium]
MSRYSFVFPILLALSSATIGAQTVLEPLTSELAATRQFRAMRAARAPSIDGDLSDEAWTAAEEISGFTQRDPDEGKPATQNTTVRVLYDENAIYLAARMDDTSPVTTRLGRRDQSLESDWFRVYLDPHHDRRSGASFQVNPSNVQFDTALFNDTSSDPDWDAVWESATSVDPKGWSAELRIPYSQLRFPNRPVHTWGINFVRRISRNNENVRLIHTSKKETGFVSRFGDLTGIEGIRPRRGLEILPYAVARGDMRNSISRIDPYNSTRELGADLGVDVKYGLTSNLTLTGTVNPDFGQVEVDPAVVNLTQFELFFPEKRPFFVEGASLFTFGKGGSNHNFGFNFSSPTFFYSRRIGREPQGIGRLDYDYLDAPRESTILAAGKITGKTGNGWTVAALDAVTQQERATFSLGLTEQRQTVEPFTNYFVSRIAKDLGEKGRVGTLFTAVNRSVPDELSYLRQSAYLAGVDGYWAFGKRDVILEWFAGGTLVQGSREAITLTQRAAARYYQRPDAGHVELNPDRTSLSGVGGRVTLAKQTGDWKYNLQAQSYSPGFENNDAGFLQRSDATATHAVLLYTNSDVTKRTREREFWVSKYQNWNWDGDLTANGLSGAGYVELKNNLYFFGGGGTGLERMDDRITRGGPLVRRPVAFHSDGGFGRDARKRFFYEASYNQSMNLEGNRFLSVNGLLGFRPTSNLSLRLTPSLSRSRDVAQYVRTIADPLAATTFGNQYVFAEINQRSLEVGTRVDWTFTSALSLQVYLQPFIASGDYRGFRELRKPATYDYDRYGSDRGTIALNDTTRRYTVDPDGTGGASQFSFADPDFNFRSMRGSAVLRWDFRPGSSLYFVWNENREETGRVGDFQVGRDLSAITRAPSDDVFLVKLTWWLPL